MPVRSVRERRLLPALAVVTALLIVASLLIGGFELSLVGIFTDPAQLEMLLISRVPRTLALIFAGVAMSVSGVVMQLITQNRFVEPTTAGTTQWAGLGMLLVLMLWPEAPILARMAVATLAAFVGTLVFLGMVRRVRTRGPLIVPLVGIMLGAIVGGVTAYLAASADLLQSMAAWSSGGFSGIVQGFYEPLWAAAVVAVVVWVLADRFTIAGLGEGIATNLGIDYRLITLIGVTGVALCSGVTSVVVGIIPFLGLVVPNVMRLVLGDDLRRSLPWIAIAGVALLLACDLIGRTVVAPMEIPASVIMGAVGAAAFLGFLLKGRQRA
ncbi:ABC transporter permease [Agrococcus citreus]|uniref:Iron chelate uptake ABC transporter family permease subunit n=1 Tax=Agrococcus citreus TaxID=84643 RepID=A0ABP4JAW8_9MICO